MVAKVILRLAEKAPVAAMFRGLFERVLGEAAVNDIFNEYRQNQVESEILFSHLVSMLSDVITGASKSLNAAHQTAEPSYSRQALYDKTKGVEPQVSSALLRVTTEELMKVRAATKSVNPDVIKGFHTFVIDGKTYNATDHRLGETRADARAPLPGRAVALLDTRHEVFVDIECNLNAHGCERKIAEPLFERQLKAGALHMGDRNFCDGCVLEHFYAKGSYFIVRQHGTSPSRREIEGYKRIARGQDAQGQRVFEQRIEIKLADGRWESVRRITVELSKPTRDGDREIHVLTNLPGRVRAARISNAYRKRWTIETCFGHLSRSLNAEIRSLCYPGAAGLCFSLSMLLFNMMSLIRRMLMQHGKRTDRYEINDVSYYYLSDEICRSEFAVSELIDRKHWQVFASMSSQDFAKFLRSTAKQASLSRYRKHVRGPTKPKPKRHYDGSRIVATQEILDARK